MFGLFDRGGRRARRLRERGVPTRAIVTGARPAGEAGRWRVGLSIEPAGAAPFATDIEADCPPGHRPLVGGQAQVLHEPGGGRHVLLVAPLPVDETGAPDDILGAFGAVAGDGAPAGGTMVTHTSITVNGVPVDPASATGAAHAGLSREELRDLAGSDPAGVAQEVLRRLGAGELTPTHVEVSEPVTLTGDAVEAMIDSLAAGGILTPQQAEEIRRRRAGG